MEPVQELQSVTWRDNRSPSGAVLRDPYQRKAGLSPDLWRKMGPKCSSTSDRTTKRSVPGRVRNEPAYVLRRERGDIAFLYPEESADLIECLGGSVHQLAVAQDVDLISRKQLQKIP